MGHDDNRLLRVTGRRLPTALAVVAAGEIDSSTVEMLAAAVRAGLDGDAGTLVVDLSAVTFMGSVGLAVLLEARRLAAERDRALRIVIGDGRAVIRSITAAGLADHLPLYRGVDDALAAS